MTIAAAPSEISLPQKNHHSYKTCGATQSKATPTANIHPEQLPQFNLFFENNCHQYHPIFFTFFVMAWREGNSTSLLLVSYFNATDCLVYLSTLSPQTICCLLLLWVTPTCPVSRELWEVVKQKPQPNDSVGCLSPLTLDQELQNQEKVKLLCCFMDFRPLPPALTHFFISSSNSPMWIDSQLGKINNQP